MSPLSWLIACGPGAGPATGGPLVPTEVEIQPADQIPAVLIASWSSEGQGAAWARLESEDGVLGTATATVQEDGRFRAVLAGAPPDTDVTLTLGQGEAEAEPIAAVTGSTDVELPWPESVEGEPFDGFLVMVSSARAGAAGTQWPIIIDGQGRPVWWHEPQDADDTFTSRAQLDPQGQGVWFNTFHLLVGDAELTGTAGISLVPLQGGDAERLPIDTVHHDFRVHDDGAITWAEADPVQVDGQTIDGDRLVTRAADGTQAVLWSTWDRFVYAPTEGNPDTPWPIVNQLELDEASETWLVGLRSLGAVAAVDAASGQTRWVLGAGDQGDMAIEPAMVAQHGIDLTDRGILVFDNGDPGQASSRAIEITVEPEQGQATVAWEHHADPPEYTPFYGDALALPDDSRLVLYGAAGRLQRVDRDGRVLQDITWDSLVTLGFGQHVDTLVR